MPSSYDAIVIGSGFGGAVAACRLAEAGASVLVLERGRRWEPDNYPRDFDDPWLFDSDEPQRRNGWMEFHTFPHMTVVAGAAVGGGSLVYANVSEVPPAERFLRGWPPQIRLDKLEKYYVRAGEMLGVQEIPDNQLTRRYQLMQKAVDAYNASGRDPIHRTLEKMHVAVTFDEDWTYATPDAHTEKASKEHENPFGKRQGTCIHVGMCDIGCPVKAKNTLDLNYLARAESKSADIRDLHLVRRIEPDGEPDGGGGYRVYYQWIGPGTRLVRRDFERAKIVVLAAGSMGSTELLLRCRDEHQTLPYISPFLGRDWSANGNWLTPGLYNVDDPEHGRIERTLSPTYGPTITARISFLEGEDEKQERYTVEEGGIPPLLRGYLQARLGKARALKARNWRAKLVLRALDKWLRNHDELKHVMPWFANGVDAANGRLYLGTDWLHPWRGPRLKMDWDIAKSRELYDKIIAKHRELSELTGGRVWVPPTWTYLHDLITPHPLGGCNMGTGPEDGVVDHHGKVFGYEGLYVLDGAVVPEAIGINPSRTIAALAERNVEHIIEDVLGREPKPWTPKSPKTPKDAEPDATVPSAPDPAPAPDAG